VRINTAWPKLAHLLDVDSDSDDGNERSSPFGSLQQGQHVTMVGRTSGTVTGVVHGALYGGVKTQEGGKFCCEYGIKATKGFGEPGDSGAVVFDMEQGIPVGLCFAGDGVTGYVQEMSWVWRVLEEKKRGSKFKFVSI
jgi:hypothetical protein